MAAGLMDYGALLRLAAPCYSRLIALEASTGDGVRGGRGGGAAAATHLERLLRQALLGGALPGSGGGVTAPAHERLVRQILRGSGALSSRGGEAAAAATGLGRYVRQLLPMGGAHPIPGGEGEETATDQEQELRHLLGGIGSALAGGAGEDSLGFGVLTRRGGGTTPTDQGLLLDGTLTGWRGGGATASYQGLQLRQILLLGGVLTVRGGGSTGTDQGLQPCQIMLLDGILPLHPRRAAAAENDDQDKEQLQSRFGSPPSAGPCPGAIATMSMPGVLSRRQAALREIDLQLRAIGFRPSARSRMFLLFIAFGFVSQSSTELLSFVKKAGKFVTKAGCLVHNWCVFSGVEFVVCMEEVLRVAVQVC